MKKSSGTLVCPWPECIFRSLLQFLVAFVFNLDLFNIFLLHERSSYFRITYRTTRHACIQQKLPATVCSCRTGYEFVYFLDLRDWAGGWNVALVLSRQAQLAIDAIGYFVKWGNVSLAGIWSGLYLKLHKLLDTLLKLFKGEPLQPVKTDTLQNGQNLKSHTYSFTLVKTTTLLYQNGYI